MGETVAGGWPQAGSAGQTPALPAQQGGWLVGKVAFAATVLFTAQLYLAPAQWLPELAPLHLPLLLSALGLAALAGRRLLRNQPLWLGWRTALLSIYVGWAMLSPLWSIDRTESLAGGLEVVKHLLFFLAVLNTADSPSRVRTMLLLFAGAAIVPGLGTFWNYLNGELLVEGFRGRWLGVMADPNHDAMALVAAVPIGLYLLISGPGLLRRAVGLSCTAACICGIVATHSRGGSIGLAVAIACFALLSRRKALALGAMLLLSSAVLVLAPSSFWQRNETIAGYNEDVSVQGRMQAWRVAERIAKEHPFTGVGEHAFLSAWSAYSAIDAGLHAYVAHNLFLEVLGELGFVGLFGLVAFLAASLWSAWRARDSLLGHEARAVLASLVGYLVCQQFSGYSLSWFLYALCGFAACCQVWGRSPVASPARLETESAARRDSLRYSGF